MATVANRTFRKRFLKTGLTVACSAVCGGAFTAEMLRRKAQANSLSLNIMSLPASHRELLTTFENLEDSQLTPSTYLSSAESLLPHVRKLKSNITTHHILRIQAASFLKKYHNALFETLNDKVDKGLDFEEFALYQRRRISDMKLAFDFVNFKPSEVSDTLMNMIKFNKMDYARMARDAKKLRTAFDDIYNTNKQTKQNIVVDDEMDEKEQKEHDESRQNLLEHELMALYTHAPYLGEWSTFMKIGSALYESYGKLEPIDGKNEGHDDGISFNDLYWIGKNLDIVNMIPTPTESNLKFNVQPIEYIKIKYNSHRFMNENDGDNVGNSGGWFGGSTTSKTDRDLYIQNRNWIQINNDNCNESIIPLSLCRLGGVQKTISISKCVPRVQGPIFYDRRIKMRGSAMLMVPVKRDSKIESILPDNAPLKSVDDFVQIQQIEEWDLQPVEVGNTNEFEGKVVIRREAVHESDADVCDSFEIEYECILKLQSNVDGYY